MQLFLFMVWCNLELNYNSINALVGISKHSIHYLQFFGSYSYDFCVEFIHLPVSFSKKYQKFNLNLKCSFIFIKYI